MQGEQHTKFISLFHETYEDFLAQLLRDKIKREYAKDNGYNLCTPNYKDFNNKCIEEKVEKFIKKIKELKEKNK